MQLVNEFEWIRKEAVLTKIKVLRRHLPGGTEDNHEPRWGLTIFGPDSNRVPPNQKSATSAWSVSRESDYMLADQEINWLYEVQSRRFITMFTETCHWAKFSSKTLHTLFLNIHFNNILRVCVWVNWGFLPVPLKSPQPADISFFDVRHGSGPSGSQSPVWIIWSILNPARNDNRYLKKILVIVKKTTSASDHRLDTGK